MASSLPIRRLLMAGVALATASCTVGPDFKTPSMWSPSGWQAHRYDHDPAAVSVVDSAAPDTLWWDVFHDAELSALERRAAQTNLDVRLATARLAASRAQARVTGADRYPTVNGTGAYTDEQISDKLIQRGLQLGGSGISSLTGGTVSGQALHDELGEVSVNPISTWSDGLDASWELDLWGRVRREVESAHAQVQESVEDRRGVLIAQSAEVARDYMSLRGLQARLAINQDTVRSEQATVDLTQSQYRSGLTSELDVQNARTQLADTQAQIPDDEQQVAQQINALSLLLGEPPQALRAELETAAPVPPIPPVVPVGVPSELARRRPDIRQAEAALHAATASVGQAVASFYPRVTLNGSLDFESLQARDLAFWSSAMWSVGPSITLPIFEGGRLRGELQLTKAQQQQAAITYQQTVLGAWRDVDNALIAYAAEQKRHERLGQSVAAGRRALQLAREQYAGGLSTFLNVLTAQRALLTAQQELVASTSTESGNLVQLYNALGGGWEASFPEPKGGAVARSGGVSAAPG